MKKLNKTDSALVGLRRYGMGRDIWLNPVLCARQHGDYVSARAAAKVINTLRDKLKAERKKADALAKLILAWESTPSGNTTTREIQRWLVEDMKPAIDVGRAVLAEAKA